MRCVKGVENFLFFIGLSLFIPLQGLCTGTIIVYAFDTSTTSTPPPSATAILDGGVTSQTFGTSSWVTFSALEAGTHTVQVTVTSGYLPRESSTVENAVDDPTSGYGNPRHLDVDDDETIFPSFQFDPVVTVSAVARDVWTMERLEDASIEFIINSGPNSNTVCCKYPWTASYATNWSSDSKGNFPSNTYLYAPENYDLSVTNSGYQLFTSNNVITNASGGDELDLEELFLFPIDDNTNLIADAWETLHFGAGSNVVADADADGDGINNRNEYISGTDPTNQWSFLNLDKMVLTNETLELTWETQSWRTYRVIGCTELCTGDWVQVGGS